MVLESHPPHKIVKLLFYESSLVRRMVLNMVLLVDRYVYWAGVVLAIALVGLRQVLWYPKP